MDKDIPYAIVVDEIDTMPKKNPPSIVMLKKHGEGYLVTIDNDIFLDSTLCEGMSVSTSGAICLKNNGKTFSKSASGAVTLQFKDGSAYSKAASGAISIVYKDGSKYSKSCSGAVVISKN